MKRALVCAALLLLLMGGSCPVVFLPLPAPGYAYADGATYVDGFFGYYDPGYYDYGYYDPGYYDLGYYDPGCCDAGYYYDDGGYYDGGYYDDGYYDDGYFSE